MGTDELSVGGLEEAKGRSRNPYRGGMGTDELSFGGLEESKGRLREPYRGGMGTEESFEVWAGGEERQIEGTLLGEAWGKTSYLCGGRGARSVKRQIERSLLGEVWEQTSNL